MKTKFRLKIAPKFIINFGIVLSAVLVSYIMIYNMLIEDKAVIETVNENTVPSMTALNNLSSMVLETKGLIKYWVRTQSDDNIVKKIKLKKISEIKYPESKEKIKKLSYRWEDNTKEVLDSLLNQTDVLINRYQNIMSHLNKFDKYDNVNLITNLQIEVDEGNQMMKMTDSIIVKLNKLRLYKKKTVLKANNEINNSFEIFANSIIASAFIIISMIVIIAILLIRSFSLPINYLRRIIFLMAKGELPEESVETANDEIGNIGIALNELITGLKDKAEFASEIGKGNFDSEFKLSGKNDVLGNSLLKMRTSLDVASKEAELRRIENQQRGWTSHGLAEFNEIIREHSKTLEKFTSVTISKLTKYMNAQLGGMYIINDSNPDNIFLELNSFYAYDRHKFIKRKIELGENLVGQCVLEKDTIFITDIPKNYVHITSGLGKDNPKSLLIVPLKLNDKIYGVVELASFNNFEEFQIKFVEKIGETLASTISNIKTNIQTVKLLEESNEKSEKLAKQEEESKKNIAILQTKLEEIKEKENIRIRNYNKLEKENKTEKISFIKKIELQEKELKIQTALLEKNMTILNNSVGIVEIDNNGKIFQPNKLYLKITELPSSEFTGKSLYSFFPKKEIGKLNGILNNLQKGINYVGVNKYVFKGKIKWLYETFIPVKNAKGSFYKSIVSVIDITKIMNKS